jgi:glycerol uptake facilitator-like aquaporin
MGDPQPATKNLSYGGFTEAIPWYTRAWYGIYTHTDFRWASVIRTLIMEFVGSLILALVVPVMASVSTSPTASLNSLTIGAAYSLSILTIHSWRHADLLPR